MFHNNIYWKSLKLFRAAVMWVSYIGHPEIVKILVKQEGIDINTKNVYLFYLKFFTIVSYFKIIFGNSSNYTKQHLFWHLKIVTQKSSKFFLNKKELILMLKMFILFI